MPQKIEKFDNTVQTKQENTHIQFWLNVKNAGKNPVIQCKPRLRLIGVNNTLLVGNTKDHLPNEDFTMPWKTRNQESEYEDILPSDRFERRIMIPMTLVLLEDNIQDKNNSELVFNLNFDDPIETFVLKINAGLDKNFKLGVELTLTSIHQMFNKKYFVITIPLHLDRILTFDSVRFVEITKKEFKNYSTRKYIRIDNNGLWF